MKKSWDIATTDPMKKPTAMELWNFRIIIVPPMLNTRSISADQNRRKPFRQGSSRHDNETEQC
jgi:hypothetical protein